MNLSDAIKAGAKLRPQVFGKPSRFIAGGGVGTCALGAAYEAAGARVSEVDGGILLPFWAWDRFPLLNERVSALPCGCGSLKADCVASTISHLNDDHHWRRETIAQWVKTLEEGK